jgi:protein O-mannosyl-transferase
MPVSPLKSWLTGCRERKPLLVSAGLLALGMFVYWQVPSFPFITLDDPDYVTENEIVLQGLSSQGVAWAFSSTHASNWHPLTWLSHMLDAQLYGTNPRGHHLTNLLLHLCSSVLLFHVLRSMTAALWRSAFVAGVFLVHPLHIESVAWVAERKDLLSGLFFVLALWAYIRYVRSTSPASEGPRSIPGSQQSALRYILVLLLFAGGLMSKPMLVTFPFVLLLLDFWPLQRWNLWKSKSQSVLASQFPTANVSGLLLEKIPFLILSAASSVITFIAQRAGGAVSSFENLPLSDRLANALASLLAYIRKSVWPDSLAIFYPYTKPGAPELVLALLLVTAITSAAIFYRKRCPAIFTGWFWFVGMLVPVIGIVQVGEQSMADRYMYLPMIGLLLAVCWPVADFLKSRPAIPPALLPLAAVGILTAFSAAAYRQMTVWRSGEALFEHAISVTTSNHVAHSSLAATHLQRGRVDLAAHHFSRAAAINPGYLPAIFGLAKVYETKALFEPAENLLRAAVAAHPNSAPAHYNLAVILAIRGFSDEARALYEKVLALDPGHGRAHNNLSSLLLVDGRTDDALHHAKIALRLLPQSAEAHFNLGNALFLKNQPTAAADHYRRALNANPDLAPARLNLAKALIRANQPIQAEPELKSFLQAEPANLEAHQLLVSILLGQRRSSEAITEFRRATMAMGQRPELLNNLAWLLATDPDPVNRNPAEALSLARKASELTSGTNVSMLNTLAAAYAGAGDFANAVETQERARDLALKANDETSVRQSEDRLRLYRTRKPFISHP